MISSPWESSVENLSDIGKEEHVRFAGKNLIKQKVVVLIGHAQAKTHLLRF